MHLGTGKDTVPKKLSLDSNDNFCCVPCLPVATCKVAMCLQIVSDKGNEREEMARFGTKTHPRRNRLSNRYCAAELKNVLCIPNVVPRTHWARKLKLYKANQKLIFSRIPKTCAILQLVLAPSNPIPIVDHFRRSHPLCELSLNKR